MGGSCREILPDKDRDVLESVWRLTDDFYYTQFRYPIGIGELIDFGWWRLRYNYMKTIFEETSQEEFRDFATGSLKTIVPLNYLIKNRDSIILERIEKGLRFYTGADDWAFVYNGNICDDLSEYRRSRLNRRFLLGYGLIYDKVGNELGWPDYREEFTPIIEEALDFFHVHVQKSDSVQWLLLKYTRENDKLTSVCDNYRIKQDVYTERLRVLLKRFVVTRNEIGSVVFAFQIPLGSITQCAHSLYSWGGTLYSSPFIDSKQREENAKLSTILQDMMDQYYYTYYSFPKNIDDLVAFTRYCITINSDSYSWPSTISQLVLPQMDAFKDELNIVNNNGLPCILLNKDTLFCYPPCYKLLFPCENRALTDTNFRKYKISYKRFLAPRFFSSGHAVLLPAMYNLFQEQVEGVAKACINRSADDKPYHYYVHKTDTIPLYSLLEYRHRRGLSCFCDSAKSIPANRYYRQLDALCQRTCDSLKLEKIIFLIPDYK
jgi:hypothetical protein